MTRPASPLGSLSPTSPLWISNQGTNSSTLYSLAPGSSTAAKVTAALSRSSPITQAS